MGVKINKLCYKCCCSASVTVNPNIKQTPFFSAPKACNALVQHETRLKVIPTCMSKEHV